jgi:hypothetical protein
VSRSDQKLDEREDQFAVLVFWNDRGWDVQQREM